MALRAVLFDRDGTLVTDVPYNGDPGRVTLMPTAREAVALARDAGARIAIVSNQSGIGRGLITAAQVAAVNHRADSLLGGLDLWLFCPHAPEDGCDCRKPLPGLLARALRRLRVAPADAVMIGDIGADIDAAAAVGCASVLVPTPVTLPDEVARAPCVARTVLEAVRLAIARAVERE